MEAEKQNNRPTSVDVAGIPTCGAEAGAVAGTHHMAVVPKWQTTNGEKISRNLLTFRGGDTTIPNLRSDDETIARAQWSPPIRSPPYTFSASRFERNTKQPQVFPSWLEHATAQICTRYSMQKKWQFCFSIQRLS